MHRIKIFLETRKSSKFNTGTLTPQIQITFPRKNRATALRAQWRTGERKKGSSRDETRGNGSGLLSICRRENSRERERERKRRETVGAAGSRVRGKQTSPSLPILVTVGRNCEYRISLGSPCAANSSQGNGIDPGQVERKENEPPRRGFEGCERERRDSSTD